MKSSLAICLFGILAVLAAVQAKEFKHKLKAQTNELAAKDAEATTNLNRQGGRGGRGGHGGRGGRGGRGGDDEVDLGFGSGHGMPVAGSVYNGRGSILGSFSPFGNLGGEFNGWRDDGVLKWGNTYKTLFGLGDFDYGYGNGGSGGNGNRRRNNNDGGRRGGRGQDGRRGGRGQEGRRDRDNNRDDDRERSFSENDDNNDRREMFQRNYEDDREWARK